MAAKFLGSALLASASLIAAQARAADEPKDNRDDNIIVTAERIATHPVATKDDVPLIETPQAISIISSDLIQARGITRLAEALRQVAGVTRSSTYGFFDSYQIRGFDAAYGSVYLDGLVNGNVAGTNNELAGLEQVEVVKGPASMLFGSAPLGGIVNLVSKRPRQETFVDAGIATGSYNLFEASLDANAPLDAEGKLLARLNLLYRDSDSFVDFAGFNRIFVAPAVTWKMGEETALTFLGRYQRDHDNPWSPVSAWGTVLPWKYGRLPIDFSINNDEPESIHNQRSWMAGYVFDHRFSDAVKFSQTLRYTDRKVYWNDWIFWAGFTDNAVVDGVQQGHVAGRYVYGPFRERDKEFGVDSRLSFDFATGPIEHNILVGLDYRRSKESYGEDGGNYDPSINPLDLLDPEYDGVFIHDPAAAYSGGGKSNQTGIYIQDHIRFGDRASLTAGGRYDWVKSDGQEDRKFSPRVGVTAMIVPGASLYASWSKSFVPQPGSFTFEGDALPPETGRNVEGGLKVQSPDGTLTGAIAVFDLKRANVATDDPEHMGFQIVTGEQRSKGVEVEATWRPVPGATLSLAYAHLNAKITKDNVMPVGQRLQNVPKDSLNLYGEYVVQTGPLANFGVNAAFQYNASKLGNNFPEDVTGDGVPDDIAYFTLPSYTLVDAGISWRYEDWTVRLNVNNIFDKRYFPDACCVDRVTPGEPRNWRLSLGRRF